MIAEPRCSERNCKHFQGIKSDEENEEGQRPICAAFPDGIPDEIAYGDNPHTSEFPGDQGIRYEKGEAPQE